MSQRNIPPVDLEAEKAVLGCLLVDWTTAKDVVPLIDASDFRAPLHQSLYFVICALLQDGIRLDPQVVYSKAHEMGVEVDTQDLLAIVNNPPAISNAKRYAEIVMQHSRRRRLIELFSDLAQEAFNPGCDPDELIRRGGDVAFDRIAASRSTDVDNLYKLVDFMAVAAEEVSRTPWIIPGILRQRWRAMLVAEEGAGKFTFFMQIAMLIACGYDPFDLSVHIEPQRVLIVNAENPKEVIDHQVKMIERMVGASLAEYADENIHIWHQEQGIDLLTRHDQAALERVLQRVRPNLIIAGPLYKLFTPDNNKLEADTKRMITFLDDIRVRYSLGMLLEHHVPKGESVSLRNMMPGGSSLWMRWPEMGLVMKAVDKGDRGEVLVAELNRFRGDRLPADWPNELIRGGIGSRLPWGAVWKQGRFPVEAIQAVEPKREMADVE